MGNCAPSANGATKAADQNEAKSQSLKELESAPEPPPHRRSISANPLRRQNSIVLKDEKALLATAQELLEKDSANIQVEVYLRGDWQKGLRNVDSNEVVLQSGKRLPSTQVDSLTESKNVRNRYEIEDEVRIPLQYGKDAGRVLKAMVLRKDKNDGTYWVRILSSKLSEKRGHVNKIIKVEHQHLLTNEAYKKKKRESKELQQAALTAALDSDVEIANDQSGGREAEEGSIIDLTPAGEVEVSVEEADDSQMSTPVEMSDVKKEMANVPPLKNDDSNQESDNPTKQAATEEPEAGDIISTAHSDLSE